MFADALKHRFFGAIVLAALALAPALARGDQPSADQALARELSKQGYELFLADKCDQAIPILERSNKLGSDPRTLVNLGRCEEKVKRFGSALDHFIEARDLARDRRLTEMTTQLDQMIESVEKRVPIVTIQIDKSAPQDTVVRRGSVELPRSALEKGIPLDPGDQALEVGAPGHASQTIHVTLAEGDRKTITVSPGPLLPPSPSPIVVDSRGDAQQQHAAVETKSSSATRTLGIVAMGVGGAGIAFGTVFGVMALSKKSAARTAGCIGTQCPDAASGKLRDDAKSRGVISTIGFVAGGVIAAGGVVLVLVAPKRVEPIIAALTTGAIF